MKLSEARSYAMSLGEVTEQPDHELFSFRVRGKIFATVPASGTHLHLFPSEEVREQAFAMYPEFADNKRPTLLRLLADFGLMGPASRSRLQVPDHPPPKRRPRKGIGSFRV